MESRAKFATATYIKQSEPSYQLGRCVSLFIMLLKRDSREWVYKCIYVHRARHVSARFLLGAINRNTSFLSWSPRRTVLRRLLTRWYTAAAPNYAALFATKRILRSRDTRAAPFVFRMGPQLFYMRVEHCNDTGMQMPSWRRQLQPQRF